MSQTLPLDLHGDKRAKYIWRCEICGRSLCSKRSYSEHKNTHNAARPFKCESCDYAAASQMTLRRHTLRQHVPRSHWHYPCPYCEQAFVEPTSYQAHLRHKHVGYSGTFGCDKCDYKTLSSKNFVEHLQKHGPQMRATTKKRPASKNAKDFTDREMIGKYLTSDELGIGWNQRFTAAAAPPEIDEQELSFRRVAAADQQARRRGGGGGPFISAAYSLANNRQPRQAPAAAAARFTNHEPDGQRQPDHESPISARRKRVNDNSASSSTTDHDHEYQADSSTAAAAPTRGERLPAVSARRRMMPAFPNTAGIDHRLAPPSRPLQLQQQPTSSSFDNQQQQAAFSSVPEAECYVEVATESEISSSSTGAANMVDDELNEASSTSDSEDDDEDDDEEDDSASCSSSNSSNSGNNSDVEVNLRLTALTADINMEAVSRNLSFNGGECQDLGNDVLPDGQVDFDLD